MSAVAALTILSSVETASAQAGSPAMPSWTFEQPRLVQGAGLAPEGTLPIGGYALRTGSGVQVVHIFAASNPALSPPDAPHWVKTPIARRSLETSEGEVLQGWISGETCGPLFGVVEEMARLHTPMFRETPVWPRRPGEERLGGAPDPAPSRSPVVIWGEGMDAFGRPSGMTLTGVGGEIGRFVLWSEAQLSDCWLPSQAIAGVEPMTASPGSEP